MPNSPLLSAKLCAFGANARLQAPADFKRVFAHAQRSSGAAFTVLATKGLGDEARLGLAIAKKHTAHAVDRNRLKRVIRESFRMQRTLLGGIDVVVLNRKDAHKIHNTLLFNELKKHWQRMIKLCESS